MKTALPAQLRQARLAQGLSVERLAIKATVSASTIKRIEAGKQTAAHPLLLAALAKALGLTVTELLGDNGTEAA